MAISPVSIEGALNNMQTEAPGWDFDKVKNEGQQQWETELHKIVIVAQRRLRYFHHFPHARQRRHFFF